MSTWMSTWKGQVRLKHPERHQMVQRVQSSTNMLIRDHLKAIRGCSMTRQTTLRSFFGSRRSGVRIPAPRPFIPFVISTRRSSLSPVTTET